MTGLIIDLFAGGGGTSEGVRRALGRSPDIAVNHDAEALAMHEANHPETVHFREDVRKVDIAKVIDGRRVAALWLSPDCKHHSKAKGGKPVDKRIRGLAWEAVRWAKIARPDQIYLENVEEFRDWGPLTKQNLPDKLKKGFTYRRFQSELRRLGYVVEDRELRACDFGAPTTRKRLFLIARCDGRPIVWPTPTHSRDGVGGLLPWIPAWKCLDFSLACPSIFLTRAEALKVRAKRPLAEKTLRRIARGIRKFVIEARRPFIVPGDLAPFMVPRYGEREGQAPRARSVEQPAATIVPTQNGDNLAVAFMAKHYGGHETPGSQLRLPIDTITAKDHNAVCASSLIKLKGTCKDGQSLERPIDTIQAQGYHYAEVRAFLIKYHDSGGQMNSLFDPAPTVVANDSIGLVTVDGYPHIIVDIGLRMLAARELFLCQGFSPDYIIAPVCERVIRGKNVRGPLTAAAQVRMCGNSVPPQFSEALIRANFEAAEERAA